MKELPNLYAQLETLARTIKLAEKEATDTKAEFAAVLEKVKANLVIYVLIFDGDSCAEIANISHSKGGQTCALGMSEIIQHAIGILNELRD